jgi:hypothetical protein
MQSRRRDSRFLLPIKKLLTTKSMQPLTMETKLVLVLLSVCILTAVALVAWLGSPAGFEH